MRPSIRYSFAAAACLTLLLSSTSASASPYDFFGSGIQEAAMTATITQANDYGAVYYNAAALPDVKPQLSIGIFSSLAAKSIKLKERPPGYDVPDVGEVSPALPSTKELHPRRSTTGTESIYALTFGGVYDFGLENLRVGAAVFLPLTSILKMSTHFSDERERFFRNQLSWELNEQRISRLDIEIAIAYRILDWLSLGLTGSYLPSAIANLDTYVPDPTDQSNIYLSSKVNPISGWAIAGGVVIRLPWNIKLALTGRSELAFRVDGRNNLQIRGVAEKGDQGQNISWQPLYSPAYFSGGISWSSDNFTVEINGRYVLWSLYLDTMSEPTNFKNSFDVSVGAKYRLSDANSFMIGAALFPTPIPNQSGRTNYVDNSRIKTSFGGTHKFSIANFPFEIGWAGQIHFLIPKEVNKLSNSDGKYPPCSNSQTTFVCDEVDENRIDPKNGLPLSEGQGLQTGNPGFPGWTSGGVIAGVQIEVRL